MSPLRAELELLTTAGSDAERLGLPESADAAEIAVTARMKSAHTEAARVMARSYHLIAQRAEPSTSGTR
ncbi:hypothetical protein [Actinokineospora sp. HUAS TT18]|uniref:hypothetical protein n=1 Tax=Actinokineospora sp. HUAS TT18 TaxID=3447451 RepID=UPI003F5273BF